MVPKHEDVLAKVNEDEEKFNHPGNGAGITYKNQDLTLYFDDAVHNGCIWWWFWINDICRSYSHGLSNFQFFLKTTRYLLKNCQNFKKETLE